MSHSQRFFLALPLCALSALLGCVVSQAAEDWPHVAAAVNKAYLDWYAPDPQMRAAALKTMENAAANGSALAQSRLGWAYLTGEGVERQPQRALTLLEAAAAQGDASAFQMLAHMYSTGQGVARDEAKAEALNVAAAAHRAPKAMVRAAMIELRGTPTPVSRRKAEIYFREAAATGDPQAMLALGMQLLTGRVLKRDSAKAFGLLKQSSDKGEVLARLWLAQCYAYGLGVDANTEKAEAIFEEVQKSASVSVLNNFSWILAVSREEALRDGARAVSIMTAALADPAHRSPGNLDTLAAAYAEAGRFDEAIETQLAAIEAARKLPSPQPALETELTRRLALYRSRGPYRE